MNQLTSRIHADITRLIAATLILEIAAALMKDIVRLVDKTTGFEYDIAQDGTAATITSVMHEDEDPRVITTAPARAAQTVIELVVKDRCNLADMRHSFESLAVEYTSQA